MPPPTLRRAAPLALLLFALALPAAAQPSREPAPNLRQLVSVLCERLEASLLSLWEATGAPIPPPTENITDDGDGRLHIDPDG